MVLCVSEKRFVRSFSRDEDGALTYFSLVVFVIILMVGGIAVDLARFEAKRKHFQNISDTAVLAATNLQIAADSKAVAESYFASHGIDPDTIQIDVEEATTGDSGELLSRSVSVKTDLRMKTLLMGLAGVPELQSKVSGRAFEAVRNVEISLVLDISGSMRFDKDGNLATVASRAEKMREAVAAFVDIVMDVQCDTDGNCTQSPQSRATTINVIPYAGHVNPGADLFEMMGGERWHAWSSCLELSNDDFDHMDLPDALPHQVPHFMEWAFHDETMSWGWCPKDDASILVAENDAQKIKDYVNNIRLHDGTATHIGMKYGLALLNPTSNDEFEELYLRGQIAEEFRTRPADFDTDVQKFVVLMTDGQTTDQFRPKDFDYDVLYPTGVLDPAVGSMELSVDQAKIFDRYGSVTSDGNAADPSVVEDFYPNTETYKENSVGHTRGHNVANLRHQCNLAKQNVTMPDGSLKKDRVTVFSIAFLAPNAVKADMRHCASTPAHFNDVETLDLTTTFSAIARTITQLRLTQ